MNYNDKRGDSAPGVRRIQRVSDVNAMGYSAQPPNQPAFVPNTFAVDPNAPAAFNFSNQAPAVTNQAYPAPTQPQEPANYYDPYQAPANFAPNPSAQPQFPQMPPGPAIFNPTNPIANNAPPDTFAAQFSVLQQPMVQDMALQYGQKLADHGKQLVETQFEKYVPVTRLKYYFAVDNNYVVRKLVLLLFPFTHKDWSLKYDHDNPVQPRYDLNAPDLYIPTMAYITFVVLAGLAMGMQSQFTPEQLGVISSSALAYIIFELIVYWITLYVFNISSAMLTLDLLAFSGYKFVAINLCILVSILFKGFGYILILGYNSIAMFFFLLRTMKTRIMRETPNTATSYDAYGNVQHSNASADYSTGRKRKTYFVLFISAAQPLLAFLLSYRFIPSEVAPAS